VAVLAEGFASHCSACAAGLSLQAASVYKVVL